MLENGEKDVEGDNRQYVEVEEIHPAYVKLPCRYDG